ncbi:hippocampus abundant transcript-like protein 1 [Solanum tuberosum]|uniref:hippocampus abundant transcript-like protein 1 n=1 Tax=Solanum tuberosum TaxID=4113 RepID=UPI00073A1A57|nr:PREDICTED: hippocampus abundant transcript-like protein 1 [Solanum tuberosum]
MDKFGGLKHLFVTIFMSQLAIFVVTPAMPDVTMTLLCPVQDECSLVIYLSGFQQAIIGIGLVVMMPIIGNLSDVYGRKALLTVPVTLSIIPPVILAYRRTKKFYYVSYVLRTLTGMICDGGIQCVALAFVADHMSQAKRASAIGILAGVGSAAFVCGTLADHFLSTSQIFLILLVATIASTIAAVYVQIFLEDTARVKEYSIEDQPILRNNEMEDTELDCETTKNIKLFKKVPSLKDIICFLRKSPTFSLAASVAFLNSLAEGGEQAPFQNKISPCCKILACRKLVHLERSWNNFADVMLIANICSATSQLLLMPMLAPLIGEEVLLCLGLIAGFSNLLIDSVARKIWIPYTAALLPIFTSLVKPSIQSIFSKQIGPSEQGIAQGCISSISSIANILSPFIFSPLTALFLSEKPPFRYPGFSILCIGLAWLIAVIPSAMIKVIPLTSRW